MQCLGHKMREGCEQPVIVKGDVIEQKHDRAAGTAHIKPVGRHCALELQLSVVKLDDM